MGEQRRSFVWRCRPVLAGVLAGGAAAQATCVRPSPVGVAVGTRTLETLASDGATGDVASARWDTLLKKKVMMVPVCGHPEWPLQAFPLEGDLAGFEAGSVERGGAAPIDVQPLVVRAGEVVRFWKREKDLRIEVTGVAQQSGCIGKSIKVRVIRSSATAQDAIPDVPGVIRGVGDVEMER